MVHKSGKRITFIFSPGAHVQYASLIGDFNGWDINSDPMKPLPDGSFQKVKNLAPGRYEYKFYADGIFWNDAEGEAQTLNPFGTLNSVVTINGQAS